MNIFEGQLPCRYHVLITNSERPGIGHHEVVRDGTQNADRSGPGREDQIWDPLIEPKPAISWSACEIWTAIIMQRSQFEEQERKLAAERSIKYRGTASVKIDVLDFSAVQPKDPDEQNITRLKGLFREANACDRWNISNHVPAIIDQRDLTIALADSGVSAERLLAGPHDGYPELDFPIGYRLQCLHGRHRVLASAEAFPREVRRWSVDFYLTGIACPARYESPSSRF